MNDRARAIAILRQARDALAERLTERILHAKDEILEDALGLQYVGGIEEIYEELGLRLSHVGAMLSALPPVEEGPHSADTGMPGSTDDPLMSPTVLDTATVLDTHPHGTPALPAPQSVGQLALPTSTVSFRTFAAQIQADDLEGAGQSLAELLSLEGRRARACAETFAENLRRDGELWTHAMSIRKQLSGGSVNAALMLLHQCFGLQGPEAIAVYQTLRNRFAE